MTQIAKYNLKLVFITTGVGLLLIVISHMSRMLRGAEAINRELSTAIFIVSLILIIGSYLISYRYIKKFTEKKMKYRLLPEHEYEAFLPQINKFRAELFDGYFDTVISHKPDSQYIIAMFEDELAGWLCYNVNDGWIVINELRCFKDKKIYPMIVAGLQQALLYTERISYVRNIKIYAAKTDYDTQLFITGLGKLKKLEKNEQGTWYHYGEEKTAQLREKAKQSEEKKHDELH